MKYRLTISSEVFDCDAFQKILPSYYSLRVEGKSFYIIIDEEKMQESGETLEMNREFDRYFYFTGIRIQAHRVVSGFSNVLTGSFRTLGTLPDGVGPQLWRDDRLPTQLRIWAIAIESENIVLKALMFFQIIELSYPGNEYYPKYTSSKEVPAVLTECKLFRHWIAHAGDVSSKQLSEYCAYLGTPEKMYNPNHKNSYPFLYDKVHFLENQAERIIRKAINFDG